MENQTPTVKNHSPVYHISTQPPPPTAVMPDPATIELEPTPRWPAEVRCDAAVPADTYRATTTTRASPARKRQLLR
tara:strand:- start:133 stop:360 length:228 start_codon:yes stop_codon:yes gene_type:complete